MHAAEGCFVLRAPGYVAGRRAEPVSIYDVAPTILELLGEEVPPELEGRTCR